MRVGLVGSNPPQCALRISTAIEIPRNHMPEVQHVSRSNRHEPGLRRHELRVNQLAIEVDVIQQRDKLVGDARGRPARPVRRFELDSPLWVANIPNEGRHLVVRYQCDN